MLSCIETLFGHCLQMRAQKANVQPKMVVEEGMAELYLKARAKLAFWKYTSLVNSASSFQFDLVENVQLRMTKGSSLVVKNELNEQELNTKARAKLEFRRCSTSATSQSSHPLDILMEWTSLKKNEDAGYEQFLVGL